MTRRTLLVGSTGLVGQECVKLLLADPEVQTLRLLVRNKPANLPDSPKLELMVADFDHLAEHPQWFAVDEVFCALGTTIKVAKTQEAFRRVDLDYPLSVARLARAQGASHYLLVSALGASADSKVFYNRVKGELENQLRALAFPHLTIARPSILLGQRRERRWGEDLLKPTARLWPLTWRPVPVRQVALGLLRSAQHPKSQVCILNNRQLHEAC